MTDLKEKYRELLQNNRKLEEEIISLKARLGLSAGIDNRHNLQQKAGSRSQVNEIVGMVSTYIALFNVSEDNIIYLAVLNEKAAGIEAVNIEKVIGKPVRETPLGSKPRLIELILLINDSGNAQKILASPRNDDSEGCYIGFKLASGKILITWEPGRQQKREKDLEQKSLIFEEFADMLPEMVYEVDTTGKVSYANARALNFFGYTRDDVSKGMNIADVFPEAARQMIGNLKSLTSPEQVSSNEYVLKKKDGSYVPILTHSFGIFHNGRITGYRGVVTDISRHKQYEEQINREKVFLEHLIDSIPEAIAIISKTGKITIINKEFTSLFGYTVEESIGKNIDDLIVPDDQKDGAGNINALAGEKHKVVRQTVRQDKYGNRIQVSLVATNILINDEVVSLLGIYRDITQEKKNQTIQEILYNISTAALNSLDVKDIYPTIVNELSKIWDTNNFFIALYNKKNDTLSMPFFADEKDKFENLPATKTITRWVIMLKKSVLLKVNDLRDLENSGDIDLVGTPCKVWMGVPLRAEKEIIGVMALQDYHDENKFSHDDVNVLEFIANQIAIAIQRRTMLDDVIRASRQAEEAAQSKQQFMSTMSHEIRTPLNEVIGITNLLLQGNPREDQMDFIKTLRFSGNHLLTLVNDVLDYNKMESGKIVFEQAHFNLGEFLNDIMRTYSFRSRSKNLDFDIIKGNGLPSEVIGDSIRLNQILSNLLSNALKFTDKGAIHVVVNQLENTGKTVKIEFMVKDSGLGIPKDKQEIIFESFTQASPDTTRHYGGTGLGLAICKKLVELQGGEIGVESEPGKGSAFRFVL